MLSLQQGPGICHQALHQRHPHSSCASRELLNRKLLQASPPCCPSCQGGPSTSPVLSPLWLLCSVVFSLPSNVPVAPWGVRPAHGRQSSSLGCTSSLALLVLSAHPTRSFCFFFFPLFGSAAEDLSCLCSWEMGLAFVLSPCPQGMALSSVQRGLGHRNWPCRQHPGPSPCPGHTKGHRGLGLVQGTGTRDSPAVLQPPLAGCFVCARRGGQ